MKKIYTVELRVTGYYERTVTANSLEEAKLKVLDKYNEADFGDLTNIDADIVYATKDWEVE